LVREAAVSRNEWESGEVKLPASEWAGFKRELRAAHDRLQERALALAVAVYTEATAAGRGRRGFNFYEEAERVFARKVVTHPNRQLEPYCWTILSALFPQGERAGTRKPRKPRSSDFPKATSKTDAFGDGDWSIVLDGAGRTFGWRVSENNHAVEEAHEHPLAAAAFRLLDKMRWTRGTGGKLVGNDEYNAESREDGGGSNYVTRRYGPIGEADDPLRLLVKAARRRG
jgi:hypothetical protein